MIKQQTGLVDVEAVVGVQTRLQTLHAAEHHQRVTASNHTHVPLAFMQAVNEEILKTKYIHVAYLNSGIVKSSTLEPRSDVPMVTS